MGFVQPYTCPCKDCKDRELACHGKCARYGKWKKHRNEELEKERMERRFFGSIYGRVK